MVVDAESRAAASGLARELEGVESAMGVAVEFAAVCSWLPRCVFGGVSACERPRYVSAPRSMSQEKSLFQSATDWWMVLRFE